MLKEIRRVSGSTLKIVAIVTMLLDHIGAVVVEPILEAVLTKGGLENMTSAELSSLNILFTVDGFLRSTGRIAFVLFCFLLVEGFVYTHNKWKYATRLFMFALVSEIPFDLAIMWKGIEFEHQNVFFTLTIAMIMMILFDKIRTVTMKRWQVWIGSALGAMLMLAMSVSLVNHILASMLGVIGGISVVLLVLFMIAMTKQKLDVFARMLQYAGVTACGFYLSLFLQTDYAGYGVLAVAAMYLFREKRIKAFFAGYLVLCFMNIGELEAIFGLIPIALYSGKRGLKLKYIFYVFYPAHLLLLYAIRQFLW